MYAVKRKLNNDSGATIIMAMVMMLLAVFVSTMLLSASYTAVKSTRSLREQRQNYLTLSSAASLMSESLSRSRYIQTVITSDFVEPRTSTDIQGDFKNLLETAVSSVRDTSLPFTRTLSLSLDNMDDVKANFTMDANYNILIHFTLKDSENYDGSINLILTAEKNEEISYANEGADRRPATVTTNSISWGKPLITKGEGASS